MFLKSKSPRKVLKINLRDIVDNLQSKVTYLLSENIKANKKIRSLEKKLSQAEGYKVQNKRMQDDIKLLQLQMDQLLKNQKSKSKRRKFLKPKKSRDPGTERAHWAEKENKHNLNFEVKACNTNFQLLKSPFAA